MTSSPEFNIMELYETVDKQCYQITSVLKLVNVSYSPYCDIDPDKEALATVLFMLEENMSEIFKRIKTFPEKNKVHFSDYKLRVIEEIDLPMNALINTLGVLRDCYSKPKDMPFSRAILSAVINEVINNISFVVDTVKSYCEKIKQDFHTNTIESKALNTAEVSS